MATIHTPLTQLLGIEHPICLGPMGLISTPPMVAAVSNAGGLVVAGQVVGMLKDLPSVRDLLPRIVAEAADLVYIPLGEVRPRGPGTAPTDGGSG